MSEKINIDLAISTAQSSKNLGELRKSLKDLRTAYAEAEFGTEQFNKLADAVDETNQKARTLKNGVDNIKQFQAAALILTSTFTIATGALGAFGVESENVEKALLAVQSALAITQGVIALTEALELARAAQLGFNAAALANPYVLIGIAITGAVAAYLVFSNSAEDAKKKSEELTKALGDQQTAFDDLTNSIKFQSKLQQEISREERKDIQIQITEQRKLIKASEDEIRTLYDKQDALKSEKASKEDISKVEANRTKAAIVYQKSLEDEQILLARLKNFDIDRYYDRQREAISKLKTEYNDYKDDLQFEADLLKALGFSDEEVTAKVLENFDLLIEKTQEELNLVRQSGLVTKEKAIEIANLERQYKQLNQQKQLFLANTRAEVTIIDKNLTPLILSFSEKYGKFSNLFSKPISTIELENVLEKIKELNSVYKDNITVNTIEQLDALKATKSAVREYYDFLKENIDKGTPATIAFGLSQEANTLVKILKDFNKVITENPSDQNFQQIKGFITTLNNDLLDSFLKTQEELIKTGAITKQEFESSVTSFAQGLDKINEKVIEGIEKSIKALKITDKEKAVLIENFGNFFTKLTESSINKINGLRTTVFSDEARKSASEANKLIADFGNVMNQYLSLGVEAATQASNQRLRVLENEKNASIQIYEDQLEQQLITQEEFDTKKLALDEEYERKRKEEKKKAFIAQKAADIVSATINTALAVTRALAEGGVLAPILAGLAGATGAVQIGLIASQPIPEFAKGGVFKAANGGMVNGVGSGTSDNVNAKLSANESIINAKSTAMFTPLLSAINQIGGGVSFNESTKLVLAPNGVSSNKTEETQKNTTINVSISEREITEIQGKTKRVQNRSTF